MPRSENARNSSKQHDQRKILTFVQNGGMLELKSYLKRHKSTDINFRLKDSMNRTPLHIASLLGDDGIIRVLLSHGADPCLVDKNLDTPIHLAARWCSREENYPNYKLVMTPLLKASPKAAYVENKDGETPQSLLNLGKERAKNAAEELRARENEIEEKLGTEKQDEESEKAAIGGSSDWDEKLMNAMDEDNIEISQRARENKEWMKEEIKENWDDWADQIAREYEKKRKAFYELNGVNKKTATAGLGTGKRGKEGRRNKKERERKEFLDHQKRRVDNYIRAQEAAREEKKLKQKEEYTQKIDALRKGTEILRYQDIPWPCEGTVKDMVEVMLADAPLTEPAKYRKIILRQQVIWHPDKFKQRTNGRLHEKDQEKILLTVQHISVALNKALENTELC